MEEAQERVKGRVKGEWKRGDVYLSRFWVHLSWIDAYSIQVQVQAQD